MSAIMWLVCLYLYICIYFIIFIFFFADYFVFFLCLHQAKEIIAVRSNTFCVCSEIPITTKPHLLCINYRVCRKEIIFSFVIFFNWDIYIFFVVDECDFIYNYIYMEGVSSDWLWTNYYRGACTCLYFFLICVLIFFFLYDFFTLYFFFVYVLFLVFVSGV
jgi:hypothetical protein